MAFTVNDYRDLVRLLEEHPDWQAELRRLLLADDFLRLPAIVRELGEAQQRTEARVEELVQAQQRTEVRVEELAQAQQRTEARLLSLEESVQALVQSVRDLIGAQKPMQRDISDLKGYALEARYRSHAGAYFGRWLRRARAIDLSDLANIAAAQDEDALSDTDWDYLQALDVVVCGNIGKGEQARDTLLALEVSWMIDASDVERAQHHAALLQRLGYAAIGAVGGDAIGSEADKRARDLGVVVVLQGRVLYWPSTDSLPNAQAA